MTPSPLWFKRSVFTVLLSCLQWFTITVHRTVRWRVSTRTVATCFHPLPSLARDTCSRSPVITPYRCMIITIIINTFRPLRHIPRRRDRSVAVVVHHHLRLRYGDQVELLLLRRHPTVPAHCSQCLRRRTVVRDWPTVPSHLCLQSRCYRSRTASLHPFTTTPITSMPTAAPITSINSRNCFSMVAKRLVLFHRHHRCHHDEFATAIIITNNSTTYSNHDIGLPLILLFLWFIYIYK